jgi:hypothetical protein
MTSEQVGALFTWGKSIVDGAKAQGFPMAELSPSGELKDFVSWAKTVGAGMGGFITLPALSDDSDFAGALGWAKAFDGAVRQFGASPPPLPDA